MGHRVVVSLWPGEAPASDGIASMALSLQARRLCTAGASGHVTLWHLEQDSVRPLLRVLAKDSAAAVAHVVTCQLGRAFLCLSTSGLVTLIDAADGRCLRTAKLLPGECFSCKIDMTGQYAYCGGMFDGVLVIDLEKLVVVQRLATQNSADWHVAVCPLSEMLVFEGRSCDCVLAVTMSRTLHLFRLPDRFAKGQTLIPTKTAQLEEVAADSSIVSMALSYHDRRSLLVVSRKHWQVLDLESLQPMCGAPFDAALGACGGAFLGPDSLCVWSKGGEAVVYSIALPLAVKTNGMLDVKSFVWEAAARQQGDEDGVASSNPSGASVTRLARLTRAEAESAGGTESQLASGKAWGPSDVLATAPACYAIAGVESTMPKFLVSGDSSGRVAMWSLLTQDWGHVEPPPAAEASPVVQRPVFESAATPPPDADAAKAAWSLPGAPSSPSTALTCSLQVEVGTRLVHGYDDGTIVVSRAVDILRSFYATSERDRHDIDRGAVTLTGHRARITSLLHPHKQNPALDTELLVSGSADFTVRLWNLSSGEHLHTFSHHSGEILQLVYPTAPEEDLSLRNCICSVGSDNCVAFLMLDPPGIRCLFGGHPAKIQRLRWKLSHDFLFVSCANGALYIWQLSTRHLDSTASGQAASDILANSDPLQVPPPAKSQEEQPSPSQCIEFVQYGTRHGNQALLMCVHTSILCSAATYFLRKAGSAAATPLQPTSMGEEELARTGEYMMLLRLLLGLLLHWEGVPLQDDAAAALGVTRPAIRVALGLVGDLPYASVLAPDAADQRWKLSPHMTAASLVAITSVAHADMRLQTDATIEAQLLNIITCYTAQLHDGISAFVKPDLFLLAEYWEYWQVDVQKASRALLQGQLQALDEAALASIVKQCIVDFPRKETDFVSVHKMSSLILLAVIAAEDATVLPKGALQTLATALVTLARGTGSANRHRSAAIDLLAACFQTLSPLLDTAAAVRLFLQCSSKRGTLAYVALQALTTVACFDTDLVCGCISAEMQKAPHDPWSYTTLLKVVSRLATKEPQLVIAHLGSIVDLLVHCFDPNLAEVRGACAQPAANVLRDLGQQFPMVSYSDTTTRLGIGTVSGLVTIYDLRTATRWQTFRPFGNPITALALSQDGKMAGVYSLAERHVEVWQEGSSLFGMLASSPRKTHSYSVDEEYTKALSSTDLLEKLRLVWVSNTGIHLFIAGGTNLSFSIA